MNDAQHDTPRPTDLAATLDISVAYASQLLSGARIPSIPLALKIFDKSHVRLGPLVGVSDEHIAVLRSVADHAPIASQEQSASAPT